MQHREQAEDMIRKQIDGISPPMAWREIVRITHVPYTTVMRFRNKLLKEKMDHEMAVDSARNPVLSQNHLSFPQEESQLSIQAHRHPENYAQSLQVP